MGNNNSSRLMNFLSTFIKRDDFTKQSLIVFTATMVVNICNYLYQIFIGRALGPEEFGIFGALFAIFYLTGIITSTVQSGVSYFVSRYKTENKTNQINSFLRQLIIKSVLFGIIGFAIFVLISPFIASFLNITNISPIIIVGTVFLFTFTLPVTLGGLQGLQYFKKLSLINLATAFGKLGFGIILILAGFGIYGALGAVSLGYFLAIVFALYTMRNFLSNKNNKNDEETYNFSEFLYYSIPLIIIIFCLNVPSNLDVIIVKHFFSDYEAGLYVSASVLGKMVLFVSSAIIIVMFPKVAELGILHQDTRPLLNRSLLYTGILSGSVTAVFVFFPEIVCFLFGKAYIEAKTLIVIYSIMMFMLSLTTVIAQYSLAIKKLKFCIILCTFTIAEMITIWFIHGSLIGIAIILMIINSILLVISYLTVYSWRYPVE